MYIAISSLSGGTITKRPTWDGHYLAAADLVSMRSTCMRRKVGAILVKDNKILCSGYNGAPSGIEHCDTIGCLRERLRVPSGEKHELCHGVHAEQNAIIQAAYHGVSVKGATLYCTNKPCSICAKMLINAGIVAVLFKNYYDDPMSDDMLADAGVKMEHIG